MSSNQVTRRKQQKAHWPDRAAEQFVGNSGCGTKDVANQKLNCFDRPSLYRPGAFGGAVIEDPWEVMANYKLKLEWPASQGISLKCDGSKISYLQERL